MGASQSAEQAAVAPQPAFPVYFQVMSHQRATENDEYNQVSEVDTCGDIGADLTIIDLLACTGQELNETFVYEFRLRTEVQVIPASLGTDPIPHNYTWGYLANQFARKRIVLDVYQTGGGLE